MTGAPDSLGWTGIPMYPGLDMLPSEMALRPDEPPWLPAAILRASGAPREVVHAEDGDTLDLTAGVVRRSIAGRTTPCSASTASIPGRCSR